MQNKDEIFKDVTGRYSSWEKYTTTNKASDFYTPIKLVVKAHTTDSLKAVLSTIFAYKIQGLPVYDIDQSRYRAFMDCFDIVAYVLNMQEHGMAKGKERLMLSQESVELDIPVGDVMNYSEKDFLFLLPEETLLREMLYVMGIGEKHRVLIYRKDKDQVTGLVTQTKMLQLLQEDLRYFPHIANKTLKELRLAEQKEVISVSLEETVLEAFRRMVYHGARAVAVVDNKGALVDMFSSNDIKLLTLFGNFFANLNLKMSEYLQKVKQYCNRSQGFPLLKPADRLLDVVKMFLLYEVHQTFMVDENDKKPVRMVSIGDILRALWPFCDQ